jgi:hypothetical protein
LENGDANNDGIIGYGTDWYDGIYREYMIFDVMIFYPILQLCNILKDRFQDNSTIDSITESYYNLAQEVLNRWEHRWRETQDFGYYLTPEVDNIIYNRNSVMGSLLIEMYHFSNNTTLIDRALLIANMIRYQFEEEQYEFNGITKRMYHWNYSNYKGVSDTSHAALDVEFIYNAYQNNLVFDLRDMETIANTYMDFCYRGLVEDTKFEDETTTYANNFAYRLNGQQNPRKMYYRKIQMWVLYYQYYTDSELARYATLKMLEEQINLNEITKETILSLFALYIHLYTNITLT